MLTASDTLGYAVVIQLLITLCLVGFLWALYTRLHRFEFFRWWAWAWTAFAAYLAFAAVSLRLGHAWGLPKAALILAMLLFGFTQPVLLVFGGLSWRTPAKPSRRLARWGVFAALFTGVVCFVFSAALREVPLTGFLLRNFPRTLSLAAALLFCSAVFWRQFRRTRSYATAITGFFCLAYGIDQLFYFLTYVELLSRMGHLPFPAFLHQLVNLPVFASSKTLFLDLIDTFGICVGMVLLLVERYQHTASELEASERRRVGLAVDNAALQIEIQNRQRAEQELRRSEEFTRQLILNCPVGMAVYSRSDESIRLVNEKLTSQFGYSKDDFRYASEWWPRAYPDSEYRQAVFMQWQSLIEKANQGCTEPLLMEARVRCKDDSFRNVEFHLSLVNDLYIVSFVDLTDRKKAEQDLRESEARYRDLVEHSEDLLGTHALDGRILSINQAPCSRLGYTVDEVLQMRMQDLLAPRLRDLYPEFVQRILKNGHDAGSIVVVARSGEERIWEYSSTLRCEGVPEPVIRGMCHDVTERVRAEEALRVSETKFATAFRASPHAMTITSLRDGRFIDVNATFERQSGYSRDEILGKTVPEIGLWADSAAFASIMADSPKRQKVTDRHARLRTKSGRIVHAIYSVEVIDINGEPCALAAGEDVTERIVMERALRESEAKFRLVAETVTSAIWLLQDNRFVYFNEAFECLSGYSREEIASMDPWDLVAPESRDELVARAQARLRGEPVLSRYQFRFLRKGGETRWLDFSAALTEFNGKPAILASALDITTTKRAEQELKDHATYMDALISNIPLGIVIKDRDQRVRFCNSAFEQMFLFTQAEIQGKNLDDVIAPHDREDAALLTEAVQAGGVIHTTARRRRKDGTLLDVELYGVKVYSGDSFVGAFAIYQDITERKKSEEKLAALRTRLTRAQEEERARIARDLHDDTGQRLALLSIDLEQLKQVSIELKSSLTHQLESLVKAASEITSDVHNVSRRLHPSQVELLGLQAALSNFCKDFASRNAMEIEFVNDGVRQKVKPDVSLCLYRVAQEAIRNVQKHSGTRCARVHLDEVSGSLRLRISDQGAGFDPESSDLPQGLGLLSMQERLHTLGGELFIHSRPSGGTCIEACVPLSPTVPAL
jgi:PAS domain S-box-containing protein